MEVVKPGGLGAAGGATPRGGPLPLSLGCVDKVLSEAGFEPGDHPGVHERLRDEKMRSMVEFARGCTSRSETKELMEWEIADEIVDSSDATPEQA